MVGSLLRVFAFASVTTALCAVHGVAQAQSAADRATARELAHEAQKAYEKGDYQLAEDRFSRADALVHAPTLLLALARAQVKLGKLVQAYENYERIIREGVPAGSPAVFKLAYEDAKKEVEPIRPRLGWVTIIISGPDEPEVFLDETTPVPRAALSVKRAVNPGDHVLSASAPGYLPNKTEFSVGEGDAIAVTLTLERDPNAQPGEQARKSPSGISEDKWGSAKAGTGDSAPRGKTHKTFGYVLLGVGGAGIIVGGVTGVLAMGKKSELDDACPGGDCDDDQSDNLDSYRMFGTISTAAFIVGGIGTAAGLTLLLTAPSSSEPTASRSLSLIAGPGSVSLRGNF